MPLRVTCPECGAGRDVKEDQRGKKVPCRKCEALIRVPAKGRAAGNGDDFEEVEEVEEVEAVEEVEEVEEVTPVKKKPRKTVEEDEEVAPVKKKPRRSDEDDAVQQAPAKKKAAPPPAKPQKRRDDDYKDEDEERPRGKKGKKTKQRSSGATIAIAAVLIVVIVGGLGSFGYFMLKADKDNNVANNNPPPPRARRAGRPVGPAWAWAAAAPAFPTPAAPAAAPNPAASARRSRAAIPASPRTRRSAARPGHARRRRPADFAQHHLQLRPQIDRLDHHQAPRRRGDGDRLADRPRQPPRADQLPRRRGHGRFRRLLPRLRKDNKLVAERNVYLAKAKREDAMKGKVVAHDKRRDLALIQLDRIPDGVEALPFSKSDPAQGDNVHSIGNPGASGSLWVYTHGLVRSVYVKEWKAGGENLLLDLKARVVETDSPTNPGDSGGPCVSDRGELVGVTQGGSRSANAIALFIAYTEAEDFIGQAFKAVPAAGRQELVALAAARPGRLRRRRGGQAPRPGRQARQPRRHDSRRGAQGLALLGPDALLAIPELVKALSDKNSFVRRCRRPRPAAGRAAVRQGLPRTPSRPAAVPGIDQPRRPGLRPGNAGPARRDARGRHGGAGRPQGGRGPGRQGPVPGDACPRPDGRRGRRGRQGRDGRPGEGVAGRRQEGARRRRRVARRRRAVGEGQPPEADRPAQEQGAGGPRPGGQGDRAAGGEGQAGDPGPPRRGARRTTASCARPASWPSTRSRRSPRKCCPCCAADSRTRTWKCAGPPSWPRGRAAPPPRTWCR